MVVFKNDAELWRFLIDGGTVIDKMARSSRIKLVDGIKKYTTGESAANCLMTFTYWLGEDDQSKEDA